MYLSQDPIRLDGGGCFYGYVTDVNQYTDIFGFAEELQIGGYSSIARGIENNGDGLTAHELLQHAWMKHNDPNNAGNSRGGGGVNGQSRDNPSIALGEDPMHKRTKELQGRYGLNDPNKLKNQSALQNINKNSAITRRAIMEGMMKRGMSRSEAKAFATKKNMKLRSLAIAHAKKHGYIKGC
jgi:hypothetical protein